MDFMSGNADRSLDHLHSGNPSPVNIIGDGINAFSAWSYYQAGGGFTGPMDRSIDHLHHIVGDTGGISANHFHSYSFTTATESVGHTHTYSFTTSGESNGHTHTFSFTSSTFGSGASLNMQPTFVGGITMIRAA
jgi:hypothetical protein